jgi:hypothetical protein
MFVQRRAAVADREDMSTWKSYVSKRLPRKGKVPHPLVSDGQTTEVMSILDYFCTWGVPGASNLAGLVLK